jgi:hypothetical protein
MFMRENRKKNGAEQPETTQARESKAQKGARKIAPNEPLNQKAEDWRFSPNMGTSEGINRDHYGSGVSGDGPYGTSYEEKIPYVGAKPGTGFQK